MTSQLGIAGAGRTAGQAGRAGQLRAHRTDYDRIRRHCRLGEGTNVASNALRVLGQID